MMKIYIVEDDKLIREGLRDCYSWEQIGAEVAGTAEDGATALAEIQRFCVDVLITDIVMPGMNGIELAQALRGAGWDGEIIMISAFQDVRYVREALKAQAVDFLFKPVQLSELTAGVEKAIQRRRERLRMAGYPEQEIFSKLEKAMRECRADDLEEWLMVAWQRMRETSGDARWIRRRATRVFLYCAREIGLHSAAKIFAEAAKEMENAEDAGKLYEKTVCDALAELEARLRDWNNAVKIMQLIQENMQQVDVDFLAEKMHVSRASFYRMFSKLFAENLTDSIQRIRMRKACDLLRDTDMKVYEIAIRVGYGDVNYFTRLFRQYHEMLPSEYRAACHQRQEGAH